MSDLKTVSVDDLESYLGQDSLPYLRETLQIIKSTRPANAIEKEYLQAVAYSNKQQLYFMYYGYLKIDCPSCSLQPLSTATNLMSEVDRALAH